MSRIQVLWMPRADYEARLEAGQLVSDEDFSSDGHTTSWDEARRMAAEIERRQTAVYDGCVTVGESGVLRVTSVRRANVSTYVARLVAS